jgi:hypothetical protein
MNGFKGHAVSTGSDRRATRNDRPQALWGLLLGRQTGHRHCPGQAEDREPTPEQQGENPHAVELGRKGGAAGRGRQLTPTTSCL